MSRKSLLHKMRYKPPRLITNYNLEVDKKDDQGNWYYDMKQSNKKGYHTFYA